MEFGTRNDSRGAGVLQDYCWLHETSCHRDGNYLQKEDIGNQVCVVVKYGNCVHAFPAEFTRQKHRAWMLNGTAC
jgi:hypothetical protein